MFQKVFSFLKKLFSKPKVYHENRDGGATIPPDPVKVIEYPKPSKPIDLKIVNHKFSWLKYVDDPDKGGFMIPKGIVIHYTCSYNLQNTAEFFGRNGVDIHLLVDKSGEAVQQVPFNRKAAHAGKSSWRGYTGLNDSFIGIEVINIGELTRKGEKFFDCYDREWTGKVVYKKMHGHEYWEPFTDAQIDFLISSCAKLCMAYDIPISMICDHAEASPGRKIDVGGSLAYKLSMDEFRAKVHAEITQLALTQ